MLSKINSFALVGLEGMPVEVETDINKGMVSYDLVGLPDAAVKESKERVRSAIKNSLLKFPRGRQEGRLLLRFAACVKHTCRKRSA